MSIRLWVAGRMPPFTSPRRWESTSTTPRCTLIPVRGEMMLWYSDLHVGWLMTPLSANHLQSSCHEELSYPGQAVLECVRDKKCPRLNLWLWSWRYSGAAEWSQHWAEERAWKRPVSDWLRSQRTHSLDWHYKWTGLEMLSWSGLGGRRADLNAHHRQTCVTGQVSSYQAPFCVTDKTANVSWILSTAARTHLQTWIGTLADARNK